MSDEPQSTTRWPGNEQQVFRFPNGYGASVVRSPYRVRGEQLFELSVWSPYADFDYLTDVIGHLTEDDVQATLAKIAVLP